MLIWFLNYLILSRKKCGQITAVKDSPHFARVKCDTRKIWRHFQWKIRNRTTAARRNRSTCQRISRTFWTRKMKNECWTRMSRSSTAFENLMDDVRRHQVFHVRELETRPAQRCLSDDMTDSRATFTSRKSLSRSNKDQDYSSLPYSFMCSPFPHLIVINLYQLIRNMWSNVYVVFIAGSVIVERHRMCAKCILFIVLNK